MALPKPHIITPDSALGGIQIQRSLRFDAANSSYLSRTPSSSSNRKVCTVSVWVKRVGFSDTSCIASAWSSNSDANNISLNLVVSEFRVVGYFYNFRITNRKFRDPSAWFHIVVAFDTTQSSADNRIKIYINGVQETSFSTSGNLSQNADIAFNAATTHRIGAQSNVLSNKFDGYMSEFNFIDGQQLDPSYFGYTDSQTGQWRPKKYTGTYGTNGYYLDFSDNTSTTTLGKDKSGNGNNWTLNNFSVSAGIGDDSVEDTPTNNWCIWNQVTDVSDITLSEGNLKAVSGADSWPAVFGTHGVSSGKWYYEAIGADNTRWGLGWSIEDFKSGTSNTFSVGHFAYSQDPLTLYQDGSNVAINGTPAFTTGNVLQIATDIDAGKTWFGINNTWVNASNGSAGDPAAGTNPTITFSEKGQKHYPKMINNLGNVSVNFGQQGFTYTPPDGFQALNSKNLATVNGTGVVRPQRHFDSILYTGNGSTQSPSGLEFTPDFVWIKARSVGHHHAWFDSVRGVSKVMYSSARNEEGSYSGLLTSFHRGGFTVGNYDDENQNGTTYVAWCWKAGGAAVTNNDGNITSSVSVNQEAGFSVATYTGSTASGALTVGHGLGKKPAWVIIKRRDGGNHDWIIGHQGLATNAFANNKFLKFEVDSTFTNSQVFGAEPTTTVTQIVTDGSSGATNLTSTGTYVMYSWAEIPGYSAFGSYTGNGSDDGPYVHLGFKAAWIMIKLVDGGNDDWPVYDIKRDPFNVCDHRLFVNTSGAEGAVGQEHFDILSNGIKFRKQKNPFNNSGKIYIYVAFAERPSGTIFGLDANAR